MRVLRAIDYFQISTTVLLIVLGVLILLRAETRGAPIGSYVTGVAFLAYGLYRARFIVSALRGDGNLG